MNKTLVSIIVPVYNVEKYITSCLDSIASQNYNGLIECILVDDCGKDNSISIAEKYINECPNKQNIIFKIIHHNQNKGLSEARNTGIRMAQGEYIYFLDSDDQITANCISALIGCANKYPQAEIIQSGCRCIENGEKWEKQPWLDFENANYPEYIDSPQWIKTYMLSCVYPVTAWNKLIKRVFLLENNLFFKSGIIHEDDHWSYFLAKHTKRLAFLNENTMIHYINPNSIMRTQTQNNKSFNSWCVIWEDMIANIDNFCKEAQIKRILTTTLSWYLYDSSHQIREDAKHIIRKIKEKKIPREIIFPYLLYFSLPHIIAKRPYLYRYFIKKFTVNPLRYEI